MMRARLKQFWHSEKIRLKEVQVRNTRIFRRQPWHEISGSFGDIGTFIPIFIALISNGYFDGEQGAISASSTLVFSGLFNVLTGLFFGIPLPVQPMKAIAAVALANPDEYSPARYASAGLFVAGVIAVLCLSGLIQWFTKNVPVPIVKGIQVSAGLSLMMTGFANLMPSAWRNILDKLVDLLPTALLLLFLLLCTTRPRLSFVGVVVVVSVALGVVDLLSRVFRRVTTPEFSLWRPVAIVPSSSDFAFGAFNAGLGQVPLTTLNSIVAVVFLAEDLLPDAPAPSPTAVGLSVAMMNLIGCWFKAMPVCHGSGGLAAQFRCGARSGASIIFLGSLKIILGLFASQFVVEWCRAFPVNILGVLLILAGIELVKMGENLNGEGARDLWKEQESSDNEVSRTSFSSPDSDERMRRYIIMGVTIGAILGTKNDGIGLIAGLLIHYAYKIQDWDKTRREGQIRLDTSEPQTVINEPGP